MTTKQVVARLLADDTVCVISVAMGLPGSIPQNEGESEDDYLVRVAQRDCSNHDSYHVVELSSLPDRRWRSAWRHDGNALSVDLPEARNIRLNELKPIRDGKVLEKREQRDINDADGVSNESIYLDLKNMHNMEQDEPANLDAQTTIADIGNYLPSYLS